MPPKADKKPKPPSIDAPKEEHQKFARLVLDDPEYMQKPVGYQDRNDEVHDEEEDGQ
jgi:hypothetical protein